MNVFHKVTREALKKNRLRTLVTVVGVILSAAMVCAVTTIVVSLQSFLRENSVYTSGDWYAKAEQVGADVKESLAEDGRLTHLASAQLLGYAESESQYTTKPYFYVLGADETFLSTMPVHVTAGRMPENGSEILVPEHYLSAVNGGANVLLEQTLTLALGERISEGYALYQHNPFCEDESIQVRQSKTYTVVGFYAWPDFEDYSAPGYTLLTLQDPEGPQQYDLYFKTAKARDAEAVLQDYDLPDERNWDLLAMEGEFRYGNLSNALVGFAEILIFLIVLGSVSLIYSAFSISVSERTRQFGLLSSVGATRRQLRRSVFYEAAVISGIGIPLGILCGIGGIAVTLHFVGDKFQSLLSTPVPMTLRVSVPSVAAAVGIAVLTVLISVWIPARRATRVSAIEAIRQNRDIQAKGKDVRVSRLTRKLFGLEGVLAKKYFRRNRRRYRATVISLVLSLVLFISASSFCLYLTGSVEQTLDISNYDVSAWIADNSRRDTALQALMEAGHVTAGTYLAEDSGTILLVEKSQLDETFLSYARAKGFSAPRDPDYTGPVLLNPEVYYVNDETYRDFLRQQGLDPARYLDAEDPLPLVYNQGTGVSYEDAGNGEFIRKVYAYQVLKSGVDTVQRRIDQEIPGYQYAYTEHEKVGIAGTGEFHVGALQDFFLPEEDSADSDFITREPVTEALRLGPVVTEVPMGVSVRSGTALILLYPFRALDASYDGEVTFAFTSDDHDATAEDMRKILLELGLYTSADQVFDVRGQETSNRNIVTIINVFSYGFIVLISLIAAANVFNTISTNVALRRREFAMLRSVGMTRGGLNRMMNYECLLYGFRALAFGLPVSGLMTLLIYRVVGDAVSDKLQIPWNAVAIAVCSIFAVVFATMLYAMRRMKRENPIDALKNENT